MVIGYDNNSNEPGVSESIGFMLIFTIVIAGIALVTLYGYPLLLQQQLGSEVQIMEKNMIVLQNDFKSIAYKTVPYKETSLKIGGGSLTVHNLSDSPSSLTISDPSNSYITNFQPGELRYESVSAQTDISLQNGAVVLRPRISQGLTNNGSVMLAEPRWFYDATTQTMVINLINITRTDLMAKEGIGTVRMTLGETNYMEINPANSNDVKVTYTPDASNDYSVAWDNYFKKIGLYPQPTSTPGSGTAITYTLPTTNTLVIKTYEVHIDSI